MVLTLVKNRSRTKMALNAGTLRCQPAEHKHADRFSSTKVFGVLGSRCLLDCHVLKGFGIYMIGILGRLY